MISSRAMDASSMAFDLSTKFPEKNFIVAISTIHINK